MSKRSGELSGLQTLLVGGLAVGIVGGIIGLISYKDAQRPIKETIRVEAEVLGSQTVFKGWGYKPDYTTQGDGIAGKVGAFARKVTSFGNDSTGYIIKPTGMSYMTQGGMFGLIDSKEVFVEPKEEGVDKFAMIVSGGDYSVGDCVKFSHKIPHTFLERAMGKRPKNLVIKEGEFAGTYSDPIENPYNLQTTGCRY